MAQSSFPQFTQVTVIGAAGGVLTWAFSLWLRHPTHTTAYLDPVLSAALGAGAGLVFVFLIANTDRSDRPRLLALALLAGFFWEPVWEGGRALIDRQTEQSRIREAKAAAERAVPLAKALETAQGDGRESIAAQLDQEVRRVTTLAGQLQSVEGLTTVSAAAQPLNQELAALPVDSDTRVAAMRLSGQLRGLESASRLTPDLWPGLSSTAAFAALRGTLTPRKLTASETPAEAAVQNVDVGATLSVDASPQQKLKWFAVRIQEQQRITVAAKAEGDLVLALYERDSLTQVAEDDDSGDDRNPRVIASAKAGEYLIRVSEYGGSMFPAFTLFVTGARQRSEPEAAYRPSNKALEPSARVLSRSRRGSVLVVRQQEETDGLAEPTEHRLAILCLRLLRQCRRLRHRISSH